MQYVVAWTVVLVAGSAGLVSVYVLTRSISSMFPRIGLLALITVWMITPAPVPHFDGQYAPAFVVMVFEWLFQTDGEPGVALRILIAATFAVIGLLSLGFGLKSLRNRRQRS